MRFHDGVRDCLKVEGYILEEKVLIKSDSWPTYHFAGVVVDHHIKISHVIRGE